MFGFLTKPLNNVELRDILQKAVNQSHVPSKDSWRQAIVTRSKTMEQVLDQAYRVAQRDVSVLITGASGTGKELLANAIHQASPRARRNFVAINCGALQNICWNLNYLVTPKAPLPCSDRTCRLIS